MIQIEKIEIVEFRGIRGLTLDLKKESFGITGPNGTGKSGIVDAIEFGLTGSITRLSGEGTAEISVKQHAPHVDSSDKPDKSLVRITAFAPSLGKPIVIERNVKSARTPKIDPADAKAKALVAQLEMHPEFALSRREIIKYILTPPGDRAKDVQTLLRLDELEKTRLSFQRIKNDTEKEYQQAVREENRATDEFYTHLGNPNAQKKDLLEAVNQRREFLGLSAMTEITAKDALKDGISLEDTDEAGKARISKMSALADIAAYDVQAVKATDGALIAKRDAVKAAIAKLTEDPELLRGVRQKMLVESGLALLDNDACPLCDNEWNMDALAAHLKEKLEKAAAANAVLADLQAAVSPISAVVSSFLLAARKIEQLCEVIEPKIDAAALHAHCEALSGHRANIEKVSADTAAIPDALTSLASIGVAVPADAAAVSVAVKARIDAIPDLSKEAAAKEFLILAQEKYDRARAAKAAIVHAEEVAKAAAAAHEHYNKAQTEVLEGIYTTVEKDFTAFYSFINRDDESNFEGKLTPSFGKLGFDVDFYGRGKFPPGAYHSEGHQDGMGLCLYLALMKHTLGAGFTLAVLDDVLMSVDAGHRREVCTLLKKHFPKTQFILTTHDPVWLQFMKTEQLIQRSLIFGGWTVETGPQVWSEGDVWENIEGALKKNDVNGAASTLRRYLEFVATILANNFRARVEFHANGQYDLGDLWQPVLTAWRDRVKEAKESAKSWGKDAAEAEKMLTDANEKIAATNSEQWMVNKAIHYNQWHTFQKTEFEAVVVAYRNLLISMRCTNIECTGFLYVSPPKGDREALRCGCGDRLINLKRK